MALRENTLYNKTLAPAVAPITAGVNRAVKAMKPFVAPNTVTRTSTPRMAPTMKFSGLKNQVREGQKFGNLGTVTVSPGGSTRYEANHPGIDIGNKIGTPIPTFTGWKVTDVVSGKKQGDKAYGNYVVVTDPQGNNHRYSHLTNSFVRVGQDVPKGFILGGMGNTGAAYSTSGGTGSHLDYRIKDMYGKYVNPWKFLTT